MTWHWIVVDLEQGDCLFSAGFESREAAIGDTMPSVRAVADALPGVRMLAAKWAAGTVLDDTAVMGPYVWGLYRSDGDAQTDADLWLTDFVGRMPVPVRLKARPA